MGRVLLEPRQRRLDDGRVTAPAERAHALDLLVLQRRVDPQDLQRPLVVELVPVDADDDPLSRLDLRLVPKRRLGDLPLEEVLLDRVDDAAEPVDPVEVLVRLLFERVRQVISTKYPDRRADRSC